MWLHSWPKLSIPFSIFNYILLTLKFSLKNKKRGKTFQLLIDGNSEIKTDEKEKGGESEGKEGWK
jgi:hypothetical protein